MENNKPTGVPEDVKQKIEEKYPSKVTFYDLMGKFEDEIPDSRNTRRYDAYFGYSLALPKLTAKEEEIKRLNSLFDGIKQRERVFFLDEVRRLIFRVDREEITISRLVEILNEKALGLDRANIYNMADTIKSLQEENAKLKEEVDSIVSFIENDAEILIPIERFFNEDGSHITKKKYGLILIEILCEEIRKKFNLIPPPPKSK